jgi:hypothetical protein
MAKDPAFLFYSSDFLIGTYEMTDAQVGQYIRLLCLQHAKGHLGEFVMTSAMGGRFDETVASKFLVDEERRYYNERLDQEINRRKSYSESRAKNRMSRSIGTHEEHMNDICETDVEHMETETICTNNTTNLDKTVTKKGVIGGNKTAIENRFNDLWALYPRKQGRADALKSYEKAVKAGVTDEAIKQGIQNYVKHIAANKTDPQYVKQGSTFFSKQAWADDYKVSTAQPIEYKEELPY